MRLNDPPCSPLAAPLANRRGFSLHNLLRHACGKEKCLNRRSLQQQRIHMASPGSQQNKIQSTQKTTMHLAAVQTSNPNPQAMETKQYSKFDRAKQSTMEQRTTFESGPLGWYQGYPKCNHQSLTSIKNQKPYLELNLNFIPRRTNPD